MKKILIIAAAGIVVLGAALYFFVFRTPSEKPEIRVEYPLASFTINVSDSDYLLKTTIILVLNAEKLEELMLGADNRIRDTIIFILRDLTEEDIRATGTMNTLRDRIIIELNQKLGIDNIVEVLFNEFVMA